MKNMKKLITILLILFSISTSFSQVTDKEADLKKTNIDTLLGWKFGGVVGLNLNQTSLSDYWAAGGEKSLSINGMTSLFANFKQTNYAWDNTLDLGYGKLKQGKSEFMKTDDKIDFSSKYGRKAYKSLFYAALINFKSQFDEGFDYTKDSTHAISKFMSPAWLVGAVGIDYKYKGIISVFVAPLTSKITFVNDQLLADSGAFGVDPAEFSTTGELISHGKNERIELGGYLKIAYNQDVMKNIGIQSKLDLFSNYIENPDCIDVNWEVLLSLKINKYLTTNISTQIIYDDDTKFEISDDNGIVTGKGPRLQFKEILGIGLSFKF